LIEELALRNLRASPRYIWESPRRMDIFIFMELRKGSSVRDPFHLGSTPKGYAGA